MRYFLRKEVSLKNTLCWRHRNPKLRSLMSCRCNSTEKSLLGCTGQLDLKLAFLFLGQRKVKNQEDFLVVEVGQRNSGHSDEYRCKILKIYVQIFERFLDLILTFMTTKYFVLTTFSTPISLWFSRNSKLNIWCSTWHVNKVEGAKMRMLVNLSFLFLARR